MEWNGMMMVMVMVCVVCMIVVMELDLFVFEWICEIWDGFEAHNVFVLEDVVSWIPYLVRIC